MSVDTTELEEYNEELESQIESLKQEVRTLDHIGNKIKAASMNAFDNDKEFNVAFVYVTDFGNHEIIPVSSDDANKIKEFLK